MTQNTFNYEISARVIDNIHDYLSMVSSAGSLPLEIIYEGRVNLTEGKITGQVIFYPSMVHYKEQITNFYLALENGLYYLYGRYQNASSNTGNIYFDITEPNVVIDGKFWVDRYNIDQKTGAQVSKVRYNYTYDARVRPWYQYGMSAKQAIWSKPYLDLYTHNPLITYTTPVMNQTLNHKTYEYAGLLCADQFLTDISNYLQQAYSGSNRRIFIIDKSTGNLIGNSWGADTSKMTVNGPDFVIAANSDDYIISGATKLLQNLKFPADLVIFQNYYLQNVLYTDSTEGLVWYIVVLIPATLYDDHLGPDSVFYKAVLALSSISLSLSAFCIGVTLFFWRSKLVKLSQPFFTLLVLIGSLLLSILGFFLTGVNDNLHCSIQPFQFNIAFTFSFAPLLIKSWRVHTLFNLNPMSRKTLIPNTVLLMYTLGFVVMDIIILSITLYVPPATGTSPISKFMLTPNGAYADVITCGYASNYAMFYTEVSYKGILVLLACYLSYKTRNVQDAIAGSKVLLVIVYNTAVISVIALILINSLSDVPSRMFCISLSLAIYICLTGALMVGPWLTQLLLVGDSEAANEAISALGKNNSFVVPKPSHLRHKSSQPLSHRPGLRRTNSDDRPIPIEVPNQTSIQDPPPPKDDLRELSARNLIAAIPDQKELVDSGDIKTADCTPSSNVLHVACRMSIDAPTKLVDYRDDMGDLELGDLQALHLVTPGPHTRHVDDITAGVTAVDLTQDRGVDSQILDMKDQVVQPENFTAYDGKEKEEEVRADDMNKKDLYVL